MTPDELKGRINYALIDADKAAVRTCSWNIVTMTQIVQIDLADFVPALNGDLLRRLDVHGRFVSCQTGGEALEAFGEGRLYLCEGDH